MVDAPDLVELHQRAPEFTVDISERPVASPLARYQAANDVAPLANRRHRLSELDDFDRLVLRYLDGSRDRHALVDVLTELLRQGVFSIQESDRPVPGGNKAKEVLARALDASLYRLAKSAVLVG